MTSADKSRAPWTSCSPFRAWRAKPPTSSWARWYKIADGVVVDTHVQRISRRLELTKNEDPKKIEQDLMQVIPRSRWIDFSHQIIHHGRALCIARKPKCAECPLEDMCHAADKTWSTVEIHKSAKP